MKVQAWIAEFSTKEESKEEGVPPRIKHKGSVRFLLSTDYDGSLAAMAYKRANREQLQCELVDIRRDN